MAAKRSLQQTLDEGGKMSEAWGNGNHVTCMGEETGWEDLIRSAIRVWV